MTVYHNLYQRGARFVLSGSRRAQEATETRKARPETAEKDRGKVPLHGDWLERNPRPTGDDAIAHLQARGFKGDNRIGLVPGSMNLCVTDVDDPT